MVIMSDIHSNIEALTAVMEKVDAIGPDRIYCLGDTCGYGPNPTECLDIAMKRFDVVLMGNHEEGVLNGPRNFNPAAERAVKWTAEQLTDPKYRDFIATLRPAHLEKPYLFVHGSIKHPYLDYVRDLTYSGHEGYTRLIETLDKEFTDFDICFVGHNHKAFLSTREGDIFPHDQISEFYTRGQKFYACVGSVGQPRDGDTTACFVTFDGEKISYHRVEYDYRKTADKIRKAGLPEFLAERLSRGY